jgi:hypothetical protein
MAEEISLAIDEDYQLVNETLEILGKTHLIEVCDNGIRLLNIDELVGTETDEAIRKRKQRKSGTIYGQCPESVGTISTEKEKETDKDLDVEKEKKSAKSFLQYGKHKRVVLTTKQYDMLLNSMGEANLKARIELVDEDLNNGIIFAESSMVDIIKNYVVPINVVGTQNERSSFLQELQDCEEEPPF